MHQGDENDFVIVSLVRSNSAKKISKRKERNRRCVVQSRAKCGFYFIGNADVFMNNPTWKPLMDKLKSRDEIGDCIELICEHHPEVLFRMETLQLWQTRRCFVKLNVGKCTPVVMNFFFVIVVYII